MWNIRLFNQYLLNICSMPSTIPGTGASAVNTTDKISVLVKLTFQKEQESGNQSPLQAVYCVPDPLRLLFYFVFPIIPFYSRRSGHGEMVSSVQSH